MKVKFMDMERVFDEDFKKKFKDMLVHNKENHINKFEEECSNYFGSNYCYAAKSGLAGLFMAVKSVRIEHDDLIVVPTTSHDIVASAITTCKAKPFFCDVDMAFYNIDHEILRGIIENNKDKDFKLIMVEHTYGNPADMEAVCMVAGKYSIPIIEVGINAFGAKILDMPVGTFSDVGVMGFFNKSVLITNSSSLRQFLHDAGSNRRISDVDAAFGRIFLQHVDKLLENRYKKAERYYMNLKDLDNIELPTRHPEGSHTYERFVIKATNRESLIQHLEINEIETEVHYPSPLHKMKHFEGYSDHITLPVAEHLCRNVLSLPIYPNIPNEEIDFVCEKIIEFYQGV